MADLRLTELLRVLDLAALREKRDLDDMRRAVVRQYRVISLDEAARQLRAALDAPNPNSARARTDLTLKALDIAVKELGLPPQRAEQIVRRAVRDRVQTHDELLRLQNPALTFNDPAEVQARAVGTARRDMNTYWEKEQRRFRNDVSRTIRQAIRQGLPPEKAADLLEKRLGVSRSRAVLVATDQMLTAAANADRQRQRDMGIKEYLWRTVGDNRVRREHQLRNGARYRWADGGEYPGFAIRCRCRAVPLVRAAVPDTDATLLPMTEAAHPSTTPPESLPRPNIRTYVDGPLERRLARVLDRLHTDHPPTRGRPQFFIARSADELGQFINVLRLDPNEARKAAALYAYDAHAVVISPQLRDLLDHPDDRYRLAGLRYMAHEWWHVMRVDRQRVYGLEEGGAELFADRVTRVLTGVPGELRRIQEYAGLASGAELLGEAARGPGNALAWVLASREQADVGAWFAAQLKELGVPGDDIAVISSYNGHTPGSWVQLVQQALRRAGEKS
ncbi:hypothetical protein DEIPH_ctg013orf0032 [Deinococcus phoenicis]|uniref:Phage head morphogenesis domain-containing protein n=1 Tax=Deinococcus phoenicis TaxID=1476583 RepID=A0A016QSF5_9DEIO|nr:minor capsid protein [Deinococcus phoenicis]EYB68926.1 hypothetical protein DEIPH_ctg013orf0032 [Deinococcus phoenicis]